MTDEGFFSLSDVLAATQWPLASIVPDATDGVWVSGTWPGEDDSTFLFTVLLDVALSLGLPGFDVVKLIAAPAGDATTAIDVAIGLDPPSFAVRQVPLDLRVSAELLRPVPAGSDEADPSATHLDIVLGRLDAGLDLDGHVTLDFGGGIELPRCMIGSSGVIVSASGLRWLSPVTADLPDHTPPLFTGVYLDRATAHIPALPLVSDIELDHGFLGSTGFSGELGPELELAWDGSVFSGTLAGQLLGFQGGLSQLQLSFDQNVLTGCEIAGDVHLPGIDAVIGVDIGLDGRGGVTATATAPHAAGALPPAGTPAGYLVRLDAKVADLDVKTIGFGEEPGANPYAEIAGRITISESILEGCPPIEIQSLRIDSAGKVTFDGGWVDLPAAHPLTFHGFPLQITKVGVGSDLRDGAEMSWLGLGGTLKLAEGLPDGVSVDGLRVWWDPAADDPLSTVEVTLDGVGVQLSIPGAVDFSGSVSFFSDAGQHGFRGHGQLRLPTVGLTVDADLVVGQDDSGNAYFYFHLDAELPAGIPLFSSGLALYGLEGLVADGMAPDRTADQDWYYGWYRRAPIGASDATKWSPHPGAFAIGAGVTVGTVPDDGFTLSAKALLVLVFPGPQLLLAGKGSFLATRASTSSGGEGNFDALIVLDVPGEAFQANLAVTYNVAHLLSIQGGVDVAFSWATPPPDHVWHVYVGQKDPQERQLQARVFSLFQARAYLMLEGSGIQLGAWAGLDGHWSYGPVALTVKAYVSAEGDVTWQPPQFSGDVELGGELDLSLFGARLMISAHAIASGSGPHPLELDFAVDASLQINLIVWSFTWSATVHLSWVEATSPSPVSPQVTRLAAEHPLATLGVDLDGATVPADARPVVLFARPMADPAGIAAPALEVATDDIGPARFAYALDGLILSAAPGAPTQQVLAATGLLSADGRTARLGPGDTVDLTGAEGALLEVDDGISATVDATAAGQLSLSTALADGMHRFRLLAPGEPTAVTVTAATSLIAGLSRVQTAEPAPALPACGILRTASGAFPVLRAAGQTLTVSGTAGHAVPLGAATVVPAAAAVLSGAWLPTDSAGPGATKLMAWARTPFAWFRSSDRTVIGGFRRRHPDYVCGPPPPLTWSCHPVTGMPWGSIAKSPAFLPALTAGGTVDVVPDARRVGGERLLVGSNAALGTVRVRFAPEVERVRVRCVGGAGQLRVLLHGELVGAAPVPDSEQTVELIGPADTLEIEGQLIEVAEICTAGPWLCTTAASVPVARDATTWRWGALDLHASGPLTVTAGALIVAPAPATADPGKTTAAATNSQLNLAGWSVKGRHRNRTTLRSAARAAALRVAELQKAAGHRSLTIFFDAPVQSARLDLVTPAEVALLSGRASGPSRSLKPGVCVIHAPAGEPLTGLVLTGARLAVRSVCVRGPDEGQSTIAAWRESVTESVSSLYETDALLAPGSYELQVLSSVVDRASSAPATAERAAARFTVGPPPGLGGAGGPLDSLTTYIAAQVPRDGARPWYRGDDVRVEFLVGYVERLYAQADAPLSLTVLDAHGNLIRGDDSSSWADEQAALSATDIAWLETLLDDPEPRCVPVDTRLLTPAQSLTAGGALLAPNALHTVKVSARDTVLNAWTFTTSQFVSLAHLVAGADREVRRLPGARLSPVDALSAVDSAAAALQATVSSAAAARAHLDADDPTGDDLRAIRDGVVQAAAARATWRASAASAYETLAAGYGLSAARPLPQRMEVAAFDGALLLESPEPLPWDRLQVQAQRSAVRACQQDAMTLDRASFGAPDIGAFVYAGGQWSTTAEIAVSGAGIASRVPGEWTLSVTFPNATTVSVDATVADGGSLRMSATGTASAAPAELGPNTAPTTISITGRPLEEVQLRGQGFTVQSMRVTRGLDPRTPSRPLALTAGSLPLTAGDRRHNVKLCALAACDLGGWSVHCGDALNPGAWSPYHAFRSPLSLPEGGQIMILGGASGRDSTSTIYGGATTAPPLSGTVFELRNPAGRAVDRLAVLPDAAFAAVPLTAVPSRDGTRAFVWPHAAGLLTGTYQITLTSVADAGPDLPQIHQSGGSAGFRGVLTCVIAEPSAL